MKDHPYTQARDNNGLRLVRIDKLSAPTTLQPDEQEAHQRRFSTIFIDEKRCREGGLGQVTYGKDTWDEPLAIKMPDASAVSLDEQEHTLTDEAFQREYEMLRALSGVRGFPRLYGSGVLDGRSVIIMEWIEGETLASAIRHLSIDDEGRLSPLTAAQLGRDLFALLARMEIIEDGIVHRDISISNIMIDTKARSLEEQISAGSFELKLVDFGSAILPARSSSLTQRYGAPRGATPDFAPPEMLTEDIANVSSMRKDPAVDVYAAASVLYLLISGQTPFDLGDKGNEERSFYLRKTEQLPRALTGAHEATGKIDAILEHEPQTAALVEEVLTSRDAEPTSEALANALAAADGQLGDLVLACLNPVQQYRPSAAEMQESLTRFVSSYGGNIERVLDNQPLSPCIDSSFENRIRDVGSRNSRRLEISVGVIGAILLLITSVVTGTLVDTTPANTILGPIQWSGQLNGWVAGSSLLLPAALGCIARFATRNKPSSLAWVGGSVVIGAVIILTLTLCTAFSPPSILWLAIGAVAVSATLSWGVLSVGIMMEQSAMSPVKSMRIASDTPRG